MSLYTATICKDGNGSQVVVHWDDNDPNRFITAPVVADHAVADEAELAELLGSQGWRVVSNGSDNVGRGWAIVAKRETRWPFYNPLNKQWQTFLTDDEKRLINHKWPNAKVPGCSRRTPDGFWEKV